MSATDPDQSSEKGLPPTHDDAPDGWVWRWEIEDKSWSPFPRSAGRCRWGAANGQSACGRPAVASLNRGRKDQPLWWDYCEDHLYGRVRVDLDGLPAILCQRLRPAEGVPDDMAELARRAAEIGSHLPPGGVDAP